MEDKMNTHVTFTMPTPSAFCCFDCVRKNRTIQKGNTYPVVKIEDAPEVAGKKRVYIKTDCGEIQGWSILYFS
jgi:hypothetical protein